MHTYSALTDTKTNVVLIVSSNIPAIAFVREHTPETVHVPFVQNPNYTFPNKAFPFANARRNTYPHWTWKPKSRVFVKTSRSTLDPSLIAKAELALAKHDFIAKLMRHLNAARYSAASGVDFQESVYLVKRIQAKGFAETGFDEDRALEFPYVLQFADFARIPLRQAAEDILFKSKLNDDLLAKTELLRLKYFNASGNATDPSQLTALYEDFMRECYKNSLV